MGDVPGEAPRRGRSGLVRGAPEEVDEDRVRVVAGDERGKSAELIGVDGADGVLKMDETKDISIHGIENLARVWVG